MIFNDQVMTLLAQIQQIESPTNRELLDVRFSSLRESLLKLYRQTESIETQALIMEVMVEAGYPWFAEMVSSKVRKQANRSKLGFKPMTLAEIEPINQYIH